MELAVYNIKGEDTGRKVTLNDEVFGRDLSEGNAEHTLYLDIKQYLGNQRQGTHKSKERSEVSYSTRKIGRQKGGGGARRGDLNSPVLYHGGRVFGPVPRDYSFKLNKKLKQLARRSALTYKAQAGAICVVEPISMDAPKTKSIVAMAEALKVADKKVLLVLPDSNVNLQLSCRNLPYVKAILASNVNTYEVMNASALVMVEGAENILNTMLA